METVHKFEYRGFKCSVQKDEYGFWGCGESSKEDYFEFMFPDSSLEEAIVELQRKVDALLGEDDDSEMWCQVCGGCRECGAYCTTDCTCYHHDDYSE